jgi:shikimate dehydrogenase
MKRPVHENQDNQAAESEIATLRSAIDALDDQILDLVNRRLLIAMEIGEIKEIQQSRIIDFNREGKIFERLSALNKGPLNEKGLLKIFAEIIAAARDIQKRRSNDRLHPEPPLAYAVMGDPVSHSLSPAMHNTAFSYVGHNGLYLAFRVKDIAAAMTGIRALGIRGASITIPHKISALRAVDELDDLARKIGALNTIVNREGVLYGYNTDASGAIKALTAQTEVKNRHVALIGAGGAARAIGFGILSKGGRITVINRTKEKGERLARDLLADHCPLSELKRFDGQILINTTPVGMTPHIDALPIKKEVLHKELVVMDIVYNPLRTRLLKEAEAIGCLTVDGVSMFVNQGALQFELWTGTQAPVAVMKKAVLDALGDTQ